MLARNAHVSYEEYLKLKENTDDIIEYIDGIVYMTPSPSRAHQRISMKLGAELYNFLKGKECEVYAAPFDIKLKKDDNEKISKTVIPDLSVICDKSGFTENGYEGVPDLIIEILSPSNQAHDLVFKLNLYMDYGVKEYWIVNPMLKTVQIYILTDEKQYYQADVKREIGYIESVVLKGFKINLEEIFD